MVRTQMDNVHNSADDKGEKGTIGASIKTSYIKPDTSWRMLDLSELIEYRDLFYFMVWREVKVLYAQTIIGLSWAILQPVIQIAIFGVVFGKVAQLSTDGIPYILFTTVAIIPWTYMSQAMTQASDSLIQNQSMLSKVYFPRIIFPITPVLARLIDFRNIINNISRNIVLLPRHAYLEDIVASTVHGDDGGYPCRYWPLAVGNVRSIPRC